MMTKVQSLIVTSVVFLLLVGGELESFCQEQVQIDLGQDLINDIDENRIQIGIALQREIVSGQRTNVFSASSWLGAGRLSNYSAVSLGQLK